MLAQVWTTCVWGWGGSFPCWGTKTVAPAGSPAQCWSHRPVLHPCLCSLQQAPTQLRRVSFGAQCWPDWVPGWICLPAVSSPVCGTSDRESHLCYSLFILAWGGKETELSWCLWTNVMKQFKLPTAYKPSPDCLGSEQCRYSSPGRAGCWRCLWFLTF